jgi:hypothetical protein
MHIILVRVIHSIQNSCIKYSTQNQHFAEMFTYFDNTNYNLNFYYFIVLVSIYLRFHLFGNYSGTDHFARTHFFLRFECSQSQLTIFFPVVKERPGVFDTKLLVTNKYY